MTVCVLPDIERRRIEIFFGLCLWFFLSALALAQTGNSEVGGNRSVAGASHHENPLAGSRRVASHVPQVSIANKTKKKKRPSFPGAKRVVVKPQTVRSENGKLKLRVELKLPKDWKINPAAPMGYLLESIAKVGDADHINLGDYKIVKPPKPKFEIVVPAPASGADQLRLSLNYYHCQGDPATGICKTGSVIWELPVKIDAAAKQERVEIKYKVPD